MRHELNGLEVEAGYLSIEGFPSLDPGRYFLHIYRGIELAGATVLVAFGLGHHAVGDGEVSAMVKFAKRGGRRGPSATPLPRLRA
jgi:hypothetical protein